MSENTSPMAVPNTSNNTLSAQPGGGLQLGSARITQWQDVHHWWPSSPASTYMYSYSSLAPPLNPTEQAFRIVSAMMEKGIVGELTVKEFVSLVNDVAEIVRKN
jgi:hypothetical protein